MNKIKLTVAALLGLAVAHSASAQSSFGSLLEGEKYHMVRGGITQADAGKNHSADDAYYFSYAIGARRSPTSRFEVEISYSSVEGEFGAQSFAPSIDGKFKDGTPGTDGTTLTATVEGDPADTPLELAKQSTSETSLSLLFNYFYDFDLGSDVKGFVGGGIGWVFGGDANRTETVTADSLYWDAAGTDADAKGENSYAFKANNGYEDGLAYHIQFGVTYDRFEVSYRQYLGDQGALLTVGYRF
ncbi:MAG: hypothetical protein ACR2N8_04460 [Parvibaculales bacterium]